MSDIPAFASTREALGVLRAVMGYLAAADASCGDSGNEGRTFVLSSPQP